MAEVNLHLEKAEEQPLDCLVKAGLFSTTDEAARAAILKYAMDVGGLDRADIWREIEKVERRAVSPEQLAVD